MRDQRLTAGLRGLVRLLAWNDVRYSPLSHWFANVVVGFDVHLDAALENARARYRPVARTWIEQLSDALALLSLATMAFEHPEWVVPKFDESASAPPLDASMLAHPLLGDATAVPNDARLLAPGATLVVSGPNMAGKTTYLRAIGVNVLLAQAGGVVRAERMQLARCRVRSSIRVEDDLGHGVSLFLAEILRTRDIVVDAENAAAPRVMFLFDEILHGTNAEDRRLATRAVLERLQRAGAAGIVTTHDPGIATGAASHMHFDAEIGRDEGNRPLLRFDYRVTPGPAVRTNALALVELYLSF
jgi:DNA mismatch repair ATPase MutS